MIPDVEKKHVHQVYNDIAPHFSATRYKPWPIVEKYMNSIPAGSVGADVGCGNGKYMHLNQNSIFTIGSDRSEHLINIAASRNDTCSQFFNIHYGDALSTPYKSDCFVSASCNSSRDLSTDLHLSQDYAISIAVIHHFSSAERRREAVAEILRILKKNGTALIFVWAMEKQVNTNTSYHILVWPTCSPFVYLVADSSYIYRARCFRSMASKDSRLTASECCSR